MATASLALAASGAWPLPARGLSAHHRLVGIEGALVLTLLGLRKDLDEHHQDDTGPQHPAERVEQVGRQQQGLRRRGGFEQESAGMSGQAHREGNPEAPVQDPLPGRRSPHQRQVLAHPGE
jgi:hypothetical protein